MSINLDSLMEKVKQVDIEGLVDVQKDKTDKGEQDIILVMLQRIRGAFKNDKDDHLTMIIGEDNPEASYDNIVFVVTSIEDCKAGAFSLTVYMDANTKTLFGAHKWSPTSNSEGRVSFTYYLPVPKDAKNYPDVETLQRLLAGMYESLLFPEYKMVDLNTDNDDMMTEEEKKEKMKRVDKLYDRLISPKRSDDEAV